MTALVAWVSGTYVPDPYDVIAVTGYAQVEGDGPSTPFGWSAYVPFSTAPLSIDEACITSAVTAAGVHGYTIGGGDTKRLIGGAADDETGRMAVPIAGAPVTLAVNTPRRPSTTRPTTVTVSGGWSWTLSAIGTQAGALSLKTDTSATPTTVVITQPFSRGLTVGLSVGDTGTVPYSFTYDVPTGHYYTVGVSGTGTFGALTITEQAK